METPLENHQVTPTASLDDHSTLPTGNSWSCQQNNANNAYYVTIPSANVNNNNKNNTYAVVPVAESDRLLDLLFEAESDCWGNKKRRFDAARFHYNLGKVFEISDELREHEYKPTTSVCFVLNYPRYREVFAAKYRDRVVHHLVAPFISSVTEKVHIHNGDISHGNRHEHSAHTAALQIQENMRQYPDGVVATMDVSGFFMNIVRQMAYDTFVDFCKKFTPTGYTAEEVEEMLKVLYTLIMHDPTSDCVRTSPIEAWLNVKPNKSLFGNDGKGLPIGNFYSQLIANLVLAIWGMAILSLNLDCKITQFVDDMCVVAANAEIIHKVREESERVLSSIGLTLHPTKFYIQPVRHGVEFCGRVIYTNRMYIGNRTVRACKNSIRLAIEHCSLENAYRLQCSFNSYVGFMCHCRSYKIQKMLMQMVLDSDYKQWLYFKEYKGKIVCKVKNEYKPMNIRISKLSELSEQQKLKEYEYREFECGAGRHTKEVRAA
ncbi:MAG: hypothetical protein II825_03765 [Paludibacteraceae bacterium]|nr:hypothetical protein [Paludibacteraceae bacterium]